MLPACVWRPFGGRPRLRELAMGLELSLDDIRRAWDSRDPDLANLIVTLATAPDPRPAQPPREGALSFTSFIAHASMMTESISNCPLYLLSLIHISEPTRPY